MDWGQKCSPADVFLGMWASCLMNSGREDWEGSLFSERGSEGLSVLSGISIIIRGCVVLVYVLKDLNTNTANTADGHDGNAW